MPTEGAYERFRRNNSVKSGCLNRKTSLFIENHESSTTVTVDRTGDVLPVVIVMTDANGADTSLVYTYQSDDLILGDYITWKDTYHFFILEPVHIIKEVDFKKFKALECNVKLNNEIWAYFKGNMTSFRNTSLKANLAETSSLQPVIVAPINAALSINGYVTINGQNWRIVDADMDTISGIGYYYIERDLNARNLETELDTLEENGEAPTANTLYVSQEVSIPTERGFIVADKNIKILRKVAGAVVVKVLEAGVLNVIVLRDGVQTTIRYEVKEV